MGILQVRAFANKTVVFDLAEEVEASMDTELSDSPGDAVIVNISKNNFAGYLIVFKNYLATATGDEPIKGPDARISDGRVSVNLVNNSGVMFRGSPWTLLSCRQETVTPPILKTCKVGLEQSASSSWNQN